MKMKMKMKRPIARSSNRPELTCRQVAWPGFWFRFLNLSASQGGRADGWMDRLQLAEVRGQIKLEEGRGGGGYAAGQVPTLTAPRTRSALLKLTGLPLIARSLMQPTYGLLVALSSGRRGSEETRTNQPVKSGAVLLHGTQRYAT